MRVNVVSTCDDLGGVVVVEADTFVDGTYFLGTGSSKCMEPDTFDDGIGHALALGRALSDLGSQLEHSAFKEVHAIDNERARRQKASREALIRGQAYAWKFQCEFAELINLKLAEQKPKSVWDNTNTNLGSTSKVVTTAPKSYSVLRQNVEKTREELPG